MRKIVAIMGVAVVAAVATAPASAARTHALRPAPKAGGVKWTAPAPSPAGVKWAMPATPTVTPGGVKWSITVSPRRGRR